MKYFNFRRNSVGSPCIKHWCCHQRIILLLQQLSHAEEWCGGVIQELGYPLFNATTTQATSTKKTESKNPVIGNMSPGWTKCLLRQRREILAEMLLHKKLSVVCCWSPATNRSLVLMPNGSLSSNIQVSAVFDSASSPARHAADRDPRGERQVTNYHSKGPSRHPILRWFKVRFVRTGTKMACRYIIEVPSLLWQKNLSSTR